MSTTAEKIAELKDVINTLEAFERGEAVQWFSESELAWQDDPDPKYSVAMSRLIRVKPKPREVWIGMLPHGCQSDFAWSSKAAAMEQGYTEISLFREVIES